MTGASPGERIAKVIARSGLCSRRDAERLIAERRVRVDGAVVEGPALNVTAGARITVDGTPLSAPAPARLWRYHKPKGVVTTARDPQGRPTVFERLPADLPRVLSIGRLDIASEGLLLLTNDGALKRRLELPRTGWTRRYRVRVHGTVDPARLAALAEGTHIAGIDYGPIHAALERQTGANAWLTVALQEGKNREVRRAMEHLGLSVNRLIRVAYGPFQLGTLAPGGVEEVPGKAMREQFGAPPAEGRKAGAGWAKARPRKPARRKVKRAGRANEPGGSGANRRRPA